MGEGAFGAAVFSCGRFGRVGGVPGEHGVSFFDAG